MKTCIKSDFESVFYVNGSIFEGGNINLDDDEVYYITIFPLSAVCLPYTVKVVNNNVQTNKDLCYKIQADGVSFMLFTKRYNYIYSSKPFSQSPCVVTSFFYAVKNGNLKVARSLLSTSLSSAVADDVLISFFDGYEYIVHYENNLYLLAKEDESGRLFTFKTENGLIDDISN